jgi:CxxC motif-containing protein
MAKQQICPKDCEDKHSEHRVTMAEVKKDLSYIKDEIAELKNLVSTAIKNKADKKELEALKTAFDDDKDKKNTLIVSFLVAIVFILLGIAGYLLRTHYLN